MSYQTLQVSVHDTVCRVRLHRPAAGNAINAQLVAEFDDLLKRCEAAQSPVTVLVLEGAPEVFCAGGDFEAAAGGESVDPERLYDLWLRLSIGPFVSISLVRGRANAGGVGFVAASDIVLADATATFGLSELLFGLFPACVLPFLIQRVGRQKAHYLTLMTRPVTAAEARDWGLVDALEDDPEGLLRKHLLRLRHLDRRAVGRYKHYLAELPGEPRQAREAAVAANRSLFDDPGIQRNIRRYVAEQKFPWEA